MNLVPCRLCRGRSECCSARYQTLPGINPKYVRPSHSPQAALKAVLGPDVSQQGSAVEFDRLRFDFNLPQAMTVRRPASQGPASDCLALGFRVCLNPKDGKDSPVPALVRNDGAVLRAEQQGCQLGGKGYACGFTPKTLKHEFLYNPKT